MVSAYLTNTDTASLPALHFQETKIFAHFSLQSNSSKVRLDKNHLWLATPSHDSFSAESRFVHFIMKHGFCLI